jgi:hypothetical protein
MPISLFFDCGAPSLYNLLSRRRKKTGIMGAHIRDRRHDDFSYVETADYKKYRRQYAQHLLADREHLDAYSNLDVINNAELTYRNQKWFEKRGLSPLPVWHFGSDVSWLKRYIAEGYQYICIGGMVPNPKAVLRPALDRIWAEILTDSNGMPIVKVHGFAMTSFDLMYRYPWYSVDSKSWLDHASYGWILVPRVTRQRELDWLHPVHIGVSNRVLDKRADAHHFRKASQFTRGVVKEVLERAGVPLGESKFKKVAFGYELAPNETFVKEPTPTESGDVEIVIVEGASNSYIRRMDVNVFVFKTIEGLIPKWPWAFKTQTKAGLFQ